MRDKVIHNMVYQMLSAVVVAVVVIVAIMATSDVFATKAQFNDTVARADYFDHLSPLDLQSRRADSLEQYRARYRAAFRPLTWYERVKIRACLPPDILHTDYLIAKVAAGVELGHPHTLGRCIMLTDGAIAGDLSGILAHEYVHIFQRYNQRATDQFLAMLGFRPAAIVRHPRAAANPDIFGDYEIDIDGKTFSAQLIYRDDQHQGNYSHNMQDVLIAMDEMRYLTHWPYKNTVVLQTQPGEIMAELIARQITGEINDRDIQTWMTMRLGG